MKICTPETLYQSLTGDFGVSFENASWMVRRLLKDKVSSVQLRRLSPPFILVTHTAIDTYTIAEQSSYKVTSWDLSPERDGSIIFELDGGRCYVTSYVDGQFVHMDSSFNLIYPEEAIRRDREAATKEYVTSHQELFGV